MRPFTFLKFRTMRTDVDTSVHREYIKQTMSRPPRRRERPLQARPRGRGDTFGRVLRRTSLDELPQLINVVRGDMSLVGPRPCLDYEIAEFAPHHFERFLVPAGVTGLWQVTARAHATFGEALDMDVAYARGWSLGLDFWLLLRTPRPYSAEGRPTRRNAPVGDVPAPPSIRTRARADSSSERHGAPSSSGRASISRSARRSRCSGSASASCSESRCRPSPGVRRPARSSGVTETWQRWRRAGRAAGSCSMLGRSSSTRPARSAASIGASPASSGPRAVPSCCGGSSPALPPPRTQLVHARGMDWYPPPASGIPEIARVPSQPDSSTGREHRPHPLAVAHERAPVRGCARLSSAASDGGNRRTRDCVRRGLAPALGRPRLPTSPRCRVGRGCRSDRVYVR